MMHSYKLNRQTSSISLPPAQPGNAATDNGKNADSEKCVNLDQQQSLIQAGKSQQGNAVANRLRQSYAFSLMLQYLSQNERTKLQALDKKTYKMMEKYWCGEYKLDNFIVQESEFPCGPKFNPTVNATSGIGPYEQFTGSFLHMNDGDRILGLRSDPTAHLDRMLRKNYVDYKPFKNDQTNLKTLLLFHRNGAHLYPSMVNGRTGIETDLQGLFMPRPLFKNDSRQRCMQNLKKAVADNIISDDDRIRAESRLATTIPALACEKHLSDRRMTVSLHRTCEIKNDKPVSTLHLMAYPVDPDDKELHPVQIWESSKKEDFARFETMLDRHMKRTGWQWDPNMQPKSLEEENLVLDPNAVLHHMLVPAYEASGMSTRNYVKALGRAISSARAWSLQDNISPEMAAKYKQNMAILEGKMARFLGEKLSELPPDEWQKVFSEFPNEISFLSYERVVSALMQTISALPKEERSTYWDVMKSINDTINKGIMKSQLSGKPLPTPQLATRMTLLLESMAAERAESTV